MEKIKVQSVDNHKTYDLNNFSLNNNSKQATIDESNQMLLKSEETQKEKIKTKQDEDDKNYGNEEFRKGFNAAAKADLLKAEVHQQAKRIKKIKDLDALKVDQLCECCGLPIQGELYQICGKDSELIDLGVGFPLYFYFLKYIMILLCLCFLPLGVILWAMCLSKSKDIPD